jgi:hypothetical protein
VAPRHRVLQRPSPIRPGRCVGSPQAP